MKFLVFFSLLTTCALATENPSCFALGEGVPRPLPYKVSTDTYELSFVSVAGFWVAVLYLPREELAQPSQVRVELFYRGKKKAERILSLRNRLASPHTVEDPSGKPLAIGIQGVSVSPDGELVAVVSGSRILVFRDEEFLGHVDALPPADPVLSRDRLIWAPWAAFRGDAMVWQWGLDPSLPPEPILYHQRENEPGKKLVAVRADGGLWVVDAFTGEVTLLTASGGKRQEFLAPISRAAGSDEKMAERALELEKSLALELSDATHRPPRVELRPAPRAPWVRWVGPMENDLLVQPAGDTHYLYWLPDGEPAWQCLAFGGDGPAPFLRVFPDGFFLLRGQERRFYSAETLKSARENAEASGCAKQTRTRGEEPRP